ncbi:hypothetical protein H5410_062305 [Solanum commersonii]|uniref:DUF4283 domain-containing protein n=1 Tax=Solanum commersonii TaxID=4109 RepID=A0A9J5WA15_SOLCO|nr:hypothetical protein H5410_062305 [Solanum commersonii]
MLGISAFSPEQRSCVCEWRYLRTGLCITAWLPHEDKRCHPNFVAFEVKENISAIWVRLPELPAEFYDQGILALIGNRLVKTDMCTSSVMRGRYARICVEVPIGILVKEWPA